MHCGGGPCQAYKTQYLDVRRPFASTMPAAPIATGSDLPSRLPSLTGLRFLAAAAVTAYHAAPILADRSALPKVASLGYVGVSFFFVLSGFVLTWSGAAGLKPREFYRRRLARIAPVSREMILNFIAERVLHLPKSY